MDKKARTENWSKTETQALCLSYCEVATVVEGKLKGTNLTNIDKERAWKSVFDSVNAQSKSGRTMKQIKKKLTDTKTAIKKKERQRRRHMGGTGGGPSAPKLEELEEKMLQCMVEDVVGGFSGVDIFGGINGGMKAANKAPKQATETETVVHEVKRFPYVAVKVENDENIENDEYEYIYESEYDNEVPSCSHGRPLCTSQASNIKPLPSPKPVVKIHVAKEASVQSVKGKIGTKKSSTTKEDEVLDTLKEIRNNQILMLEEMRKSNEILSRIYVIPSE